MRTTSRTTLTALAAALAMALSSAAAVAAPAQQTVTGSLIPVKLHTVRITSPSMAMIRAIAIRPIVTPLVSGKCAVTGAVFSDVRSVADGPMPGIQTALIGSDGQRIATRTDYSGIYHAVVPAGTWRETRPQVGTLPFGVRPTRPRIGCD